MRRAAILVAGALLAMVLGSAATWIREPAWPGWTWSATVAAPALVLAGHLTGRRGPVAGGALLLLVLGIAEANGHVWVPLHAVIEWELDGAGWQARSFGSTQLPLLACAVPGALLVLASSLHRRPPASRSTSLLTVAWVTAGAIAVRLVLQALDAVPVNRVGGVGFNALALCIAFVTAAALVALSVRLARRERDPAGLLAMSLAVGALLPVAAFYGASTLLIDERATLAAWVASALGIAIAMRSLVRRSVVAT